MFTPKADLLGEGSLDAAAAGSRAKSDALVDPLLDNEIPFSIELTMRQVLAVAEEANLRAMMLDWSIGRIPTTPTAFLKLSCLRNAAMDLHGCSQRLLESWRDSAGSP